MGFTQPFNGSSAPSTSTSGGTTTTTSTTSGGQITTTTTTPTTPTIPNYYTPPTTTNITNIQGDNGIVVLTNSTQNSQTNGSNVRIGGTNGINVNTSDGTPYTDVGNGIMQIGKFSTGEQAVVITTNTYAPAVFCTSDERLKTDIKLLENSLDKINKLKGVCYTWKDGHGGKEIGVIAQDIQAQYPELVSINKDNFLTVDYPKLTAVLIEGMKEMKKEMDTIKESLKRKPRQNKKNTEKKTEKETEKETEKKPRKTRVKKV